MEVDSIHELVTLVGVLAPGFIILFFRSQFISGSLPAIKEGVFYYVLVSLVYFSVTAPLQPILNESTTWGAFILYCVIPFAVGLLLGVAYQRGWTKKVTSLLGLKVMHSAPCAWDYAFGKLNGYSWINVELKDGRHVKGLFGPASFASAGDRESDIFIEELTDDNFHRLPRKAGLWVRRSEISMIEMISDSGD